MGGAVASRTKGVERGAGGKFVKRGATPAQAKRAKATDEAESGLVEVNPQRRAKVITSENIKLRPGQFLIRTPEVYEEVKVGRNTVRQLRPYNGSAHGVAFTNNVAVIDDESVREIRDVMLSEIEGDENKLPAWLRNASAEDLARQLASDFGYTVFPELSKLKLTRRQIERTMPGANDGSDRPVTMGEGGGANLRETPMVSRPLPGVDDAGIAGDQGTRDGMPSEPAKT